MVLDDRTEDAFQRRRGEDRRSLVSLRCLHLHASLRGEPAELCREIGAALHPRQAGGDEPQPGAEQGGEGERRDHCNTRSSSSSRVARSMPP